MSPESLLQHRDFVRALARRLVADGDRAEDVVQQTWLAAIRRPPKRSGVRAWLAAVVRNAARKQVRDERRRRHHEPLAPVAGPAPTPEEVLERESARRRVVEAVLSLEPVYRDVILLRYFEDLTPTEVAVRTNTPVETVKTRLKRATQRLRGALDREFGSRGAWACAITPLAGARLDLAAAAHTSTAGVLVMTAKVKLIAVAVVLLGTAVAFFQNTGDDPTVPDTPPATGRADPQVASAPRGESDPSPDPSSPSRMVVPDPPPAAADAEGAAEASTAAEPAATTEATAMEHWVQQLGVIADSFRTDQPDYIAWLSLMDELLDRAELVEGSVHVNDRGATCGRFEVPGDLYVSFEVKGDAYTVAVRNLRTTLPEGSPFSELSSSVSFRAGPGGIASAHGQVRFRDLTYTGLEAQTLGYQLDMDPFTVALTPLTQRANPGVDGSWIYGPGPVQHAPYRALGGLARWHEAIEPLTQQ